MKQKYNDKMSEQEFLDQSLRRNRPRIIFPIINSCLALFLIVSCIVLFTKQKIEIGFFVFAMIVSVLFPLCSWYNSFFSRRKNQKKLYSFKKETEIMVAYTTKFKGYKIIEITDDNYPRIEFEYLNDLELKKVEYDGETCVLNKGLLKGTLIACGISFAGMCVNPETSEVVGMSGMIPRSIWYYRRLTVPQAASGKVKIISADIANFTIMQMLKDSNNYYDKKTGWLCIGERKNNINDQTIKFMDNAILVLNNGKLKALWIEVGYKLEIN